jgi:hypothetical protein
VRGGNGGGEGGAGGSGGIDLGTGEIRKSENKNPKKNSMRQSPLGVA